MTPDPFQGLSPDALRFAAVLLVVFAPHPDIKPSAWCEANLVLTSDFAAEPGKR